MAVDESNRNNETPAAPAPAGYSTDGRIFVLISIAVVALMFVGMVALLFVRDKPAPSSLLVLRVPAKYDGAVVTVDTADGRDLKPISTMLEADKVVRICLPPGAYEVKIDYNGKRISRHFMQMADYSYYPIDLANPPATRPVTRQESRR
jgi:hypothetical protein